MHHTQVRMTLAATALCTKDAAVALRFALAPADTLPEHTPSRVPVLGKLPEPGEVHVVDPYEEQPLEKELLQ